MAETESCGEDEEQDGAEALDEPSVAEPQRVAEAAGPTEPGNCGGERDTGGICTVTPG